MTKATELANDLMAFHEACTMDGQGGDGQFRILCSSGSSEQAIALRSTLREVADYLRAMPLDPTEEMITDGAEAMIAADGPDGPSYVSLARACLNRVLGPRGLEVIMIDGSGHYVNEKVKAEIESLRSALKQLVEECVNPGDGGPFEAGEFPALDAARAALHQ